MIGILNNIVSTLQNIFIVIPKDLAEFNIGVLIQGALLFAMFYFPSRWFRAYLIRLFLLIFGLTIFWRACARESILFTYDFYAGIAIFLPHIEIIEITYLILREKTLFIYNRLLALIWLIISPFVWLYRQISKLVYYFKAKQDRRAQQRQFQEEFKRQQEEEYRKEQTKYDYEDRTRGENRKSRQKQQNKRQYYEEKKEKSAKKEEAKTSSRWDSSNPYEVLGIDGNATKKEIKKAYRNLSKIYHPDLTLTQKEKHKVIFQKIGNAYGKLKS